MNPQYFEGVLQLRNPTQKIIDFVADEVDRKENVWIAKTEKNKNGVDIYLSSNKFIRDIGRKLKRNFTGQLIESNRPFSQNRLTSKCIYRGCVLFRHFNIEIGQIMEIKGDKIKVISIGNDIYGMNLTDNKKVHIKFDKIA